RKMGGGRANSKSGMSRETLGPFSKWSGLDGSGGPSECTRSNRLSCRATNSFSLNPNSDSPESAQWLATTRVGDERGRKSLSSGGQEQGDAGWRKNKLSRR